KQGTVAGCYVTKGRVTRKYIKDRHALVDIEIKGENQRGELTTPGMATVILPCRNVISTVYCELDTELPLARFVMPY
ncbi:MAG: hypothetical protein AAB092_06870, partial [Chloroflexota bacterium]